LAAGVSVLWPAPKPLAEVEPEAFLADKVRFSIEREVGITLDKPIGLARMKSGTGWILSALAPRPTPHLKVIFRCG
jgi:hypothetical protein